MALLYPGYKSYFNRFRTKPFHTEYTTRYCNSEAPVLYSQVPKYTWNEPRRPAVATRHELDGATKLTHLRPPFAARMTSYEPEGKYLGVKTARGEATLLGRSGSSERKVNFSVKPPDAATNLNTSPPTERGSSREEFVEDHGLQMLKMSSTQTARNATTTAKQVQLERSLCTSSPLEPSPSLSRIASSFSVARARKFGKAHQTLTRHQHLEEVMTSRPSDRDERRILGRVAPRPSTLLSKHPKDVRYVRDTCFFQPTQERKRHYYIVNPNWFSEQRVTIPKNNVFS